MATKAKNTAAKAETKTTKVAPAKVEEAKVEAVKAEVKEEVKEAPAKKATAAKKTETTKKVAEKKTEFFVQFSGLEFSYEDLLEKVKADYIAQTGKKAISSAKVYVKPEDNKVYYVIDNNAGDFALVD